jgi:outer membrane protein OmpA-like peptidoglycan-associated protein
MKHLKKFHSLFFTLIVLSLMHTSCVSSKRSAVLKKITEAKVIAVSESDILKNSLRVTGEKYKEEKIDSVIHSNISYRLNEYINQLDTFDVYVNFVDSLIKSNKVYRKNKTSVTQKLVYIKNYSSGSLQRLRRFAMIDDGLSIAEQYLFNLAAFFGPGKYKIPDEKTAEATERFSPILDTISSFYKKYSDVNKFATIRILGFADGTGFNPESETAKSLFALLKDSLAPKAQLNGKLSELRAKNIADLLDNILSSKIQNYAAVQHLDFLFLETGKGEEYPSKKITDYQVNDDRRRVVLLFWSILPK